MSFYNFIIFLLLAALIIFGLFFLKKKAKQKKSLVLALSWVSILIGMFLLAMDLGLIALKLGTEQIIDYLLFIRSADDSNYAGRWIFTGYFFLALGLLLISYYLCKSLFLEKSITKG